MLFNSVEFIVFLLLVYGAYLLLPFRLQNYMLLVASYIFYGWWDVRFLFLVALSTTVDSWVGLMLANGKLARGQQLMPAAFLCLSAVVFLGLNPSALWPVAGESVSPPIHQNARNYLGVCRNNRFPDSHAVSVSGRGKSRAVVLALMSADLAMIQLCPRLPGI
jgi:D-alanyl-lipoteichoic acid acyltransferase DltB (MBOAT superfamily)